MPIAAALIVSAGALLGVFLGAAFAANRVSAQMEENRVLFEGQVEAERERLQTQLDAAAERLDQQLRADRAKQDRAELRDTLDKGAELLGQASQGLFIATQEARSAQEEGWAAEVEGIYLIDQDDSLALVRSISSYSQRLLVRFKAGDTIQRAVVAALNAYADALLVAATPRGEIDAEGLASLIRHGGRFDASYAAFLVQCRRRLGVSDD